MITIILLIISALTALTALLMNIVLIKIACADKHDYDDIDIRKLLGGTCNDDTEETKNEKL